MNKKTIVIGVIVLIILATGAGFWGWKKNEAKKQEQAKIEQIKQEEGKNAEKADEDEIDTSDWRTYRDNEYGFEIKYPGNWEKDEFDGISFFPEGFREVSRVGISEESKKIISNKEGSYIFNISVYKEEEKYFDTVSEWRKHDFTNIKVFPEDEGTYELSNVDFSNQEMLIFKENRHDDKRIKVTRYYFFHNNDGYEITALYAGKNDGINEKIMSSLKFDN